MAPSAAQFCAADGAFDLRGKRIFFFGMSNNKGMKKKIMPAHEFKTRDERESCIPAFSGKEER